MGEQAENLGRKWGKSKENQERKQRETGEILWRTCGKSLENMGETVENLGRNCSKSKENLVRAQGEPGKILERSQINLGKP